MDKILVCVFLVFVFASSLLLFSFYQSMACYYMHNKKIHGADTSTSFL